MVEWLKQTNKKIKQQKNLDAQAREWGLDAQNSGVGMMSSIP